MTTDILTELFSGAHAIHTALWLIGIAGGVGFTIKGLVPALYRLGNGLARRKIAIFAAPTAYGEIKQLLIDSKLFKDKNITHIHSPAEIDVARNKGVHLVYWPDWKDSLDLILAERRPSVPCIIYAPQAFGLIPKPDMDRLDNQHRHTIVTNFKGRLLNDIVTAMISTSYEK